MYFSVAVHHKSYEEKELLKSSGYLLHEFSLSLSFSQFTCQVKISREYLHFAILYTKQVCNQITVAASLHDILCYHAGRKYEILIFKESLQLTS